jgi:hypothetical protein
MAMSVSQFMLHIDMQQLKQKIERKNFPIALVPIEIDSRSSLNVYGNE